MARDAGGGGDCDGTGGETDWGEAGTPSARKARATKISGFMIFSLGVTQDGEVDDATGD
jgi:hypothetical protein